MKLVNVIFCWLLAIQLSNAQKTELKISTGYHFSSASQHFIDNINTSSNNYSYKRVDASLGKGIMFAAGMTYYFRSWLGISIDIEYNKGLPAVKGTNEFYAIDYSHREQTKWNSQTLSIAPSLKIRVPGKKLDPFTSFGFILPAWSKINVTSDYKTSSFGRVYTGETTKIFRLKNSIGYMASIGIAPRLSKKTSVIAEICLVSQSIQVKRSTVVSDISNGVEQIGIYSVYAKETIYVKKTGLNDYDPNKPRKEPGFSLPYSSIGLNVGISIKL